MYEHRRDADAAPAESGRPPAENDKQNRPARDPRWARLTVALGLLLMMISGLALAGGRFLTDRYLGNVHQEHLLGAAAAPPPRTGKATATHVRIDGPINLLLAGIDERADDPSNGARADSIIIAHVTARHDHAYLISIPRDSRVEIPPFPKTAYPGGTDKINASFAYGFARSGGRPGGFELLALAINKLTGISFNAGAIINFEGLRAVVDAVGGVDMCVDEQTASVHIGQDAGGKPAAPYRLVPPDYHPSPIPGIRPQVYRVGCQSFVGWQALDYVRQRELIPDGDYGRQRHQQQLVTSLAKKITNAGMLTDPVATDRTLRAVGDAVTFDGNGVSLADWILMLKNLDPGAITMVKTNSGQYNTQVIDGQDFEFFTEPTRQLFAAIHDDTLAAFVATHPDWVNAAATP